MAYRTNDDGPCANCMLTDCETCKIAVNLETALVGPKPAMVVELPDEETLERIMSDAGYFVACPNDFDFVEVEATGRIDRSDREREEYDEMLSWAFERA